MVKTNVDQETGMSSEQSMAGQMQQDGHLSIQTNEVRNAIIHYFRSPHGKLSELERIPTGGARSGTISR